MLNISSISWTPRKNTKPILQNISLSISEGELVVLIGANGSGKSSLMRSVSGWITPSEGSIQLHNQSLSQLSIAKRSELMAVLPQKLNLYENISVLEWLGYARFRFSESHNRRNQYIETLLQQQHLLHLKDRCFSELSGGEAQRVALVALMAQESKMWLLDEPANHLDPKVQIDIYRSIVTQWSSGKTILLITHNINLLLRSISREQQQYVRLIGIEEGKLLFTETLDSPDLIEKISMLYRLPVQLIDAFDFPQLIFGSAS